MPQSFCPKFITLLLLVGRTIDEFMSLKRPIIDKFFRVVHHNHITWSLLVCQKIKKKFLVVHPNYIT